MKGFIIPKSVVTFDEKKEEEQFKRYFRTFMWPILIAAMVVNVHASLKLRGLYADGAAYVIAIIQERGFVLTHNSRITVHILQQWLTVLAVKLGVTNLEIVIALYCFMTQLLPLALVILCYIILPKSQKELFFFPLLHYLAGATAASFASVAEAPVATAYFWVLLYLILFRANDLRMRLVIVLVSLPVLWLHEVMAFLCPLLVMASWWQGKQQVKTRSRAVFWSLAAWFVIVALVQVGYIVAPISVENRDGFIHDFFKLVWLGTLGHTTNSNIPALNLPAFLGIGGIIVMLMISDAWPKRYKVCNGGLWYSTIIAAYGIICVISVVAVATVDWVFVPNPQFAARNHPSFVSVPLAVLTFASIVWTRTRKYWMRKLNVVIFVFLTVGTLGWQITATQYWSGFVKTYREILNSHKGLVGWEEILEDLPEKKGATVKKMSWDWTNPTLSFLLSPEGKVSTVIANPKTVLSQPFDPADLGSLPNSRLFDTSKYVRVEQTRRSTIVP